MIISKSQLIFLYFSSIWDHLVNITSSKTRTVIITTHYIDETRQAGMVNKTLKGRIKIMEDFLNG